LSSILRALKRIEKQAPPQDESHPWPRPIDPKKAVQSKVKKRWLVNKIVSALVILVVVLVAGWFAYSQRHLILAKFLPAESSENTPQKSAPSGEKKPIYQAKIKTSPGRENKTEPGESATPGNQKDNKTPSKKVSAPPPAKPIDSKQIPKNITRPLKSSKPVPVKKKTALKSRTKRTQPFQPSRSGQMPPKASANKPSPRAPAAQKTAGGRETRLDSLSTITDSKLKLQAIAWSDDVARRMAVINNQIVREGGMVDGFSVTNIRKDDVIVNDGSASWRLEFSLKQ
jgi:cytoskeletal protein RodZ